MTCVVIKRKKIILNGREVEVDVFNTSLVPGRGDEEKVIEGLLKEEEIEKEINDKLQEIDSVQKDYAEKDKDIWFYYKIGNILQFVDLINLTEQRGQIWERIAGNLRPEIFFGKSKPPKKSRLYPELMYLLAKQNREDIPRVSWSHWYEILQYSKVFKNQKILQMLLRECEEKHLSSDLLRNHVQKINKNLW